MIRFGTVNSDDYGALVTRKETDSAPEEQYEKVSVPGRLGDLLFDKRTRDNVEMQYNVVFHQNARASCEAMKMALQALTGYQRLEDSDYPDEFYLAYISKDIEPKFTPDKDLAKFVLTLSRKPPRFLTSGETKYSPISGALTGNPIYVDGSTISAPNIVFHIDLPYKGKETTDLQDVVFDYADKSELYVNGQTVFSMSWAEKIIKADLSLTSGGSIERILSDVPTSGWTKVSGYGSRYKINLNTSEVLGCSFASVVDSAAPDYQKIVGTCWVDSVTGEFTVVAPASITTKSAFESWLAGKSIKPQVVIDVISAVTWNRPDPVFPNAWISLETNAGELTVDVQSSNILSNPTKYPSKPLIRIYGNGTATINGQTITVINSTSYVDIDCEMQDCYEGSVNRNNDVTFSTYDFPSLEPGDNVFLAGTGITGFLVTPRWWKL